MLEVNIIMNEAKPKAQFFRELAVGDIFTCTSSPFLYDRDYIGIPFMKTSYTTLEKNVLNLNTMSTMRVAKHQGIELVSNAELNITI
jgi:hypothetical protein